MPQFYPQYIENEAKLVKINPFLDKN